MPVCTLYAHEVSEFTALIFSETWPACRCCAGVVVGRGHTD